MPGALADRIVVITRPIEQAPALAALIEAEGATVVVMPLIELVDVATPLEVREALADLGPHDWVVVASAHAATRVASVLTDCPARVAAVGATTAAVLPRVDLVAERQSAAGLVEMFPAGRGVAVVVQAADGAPTLVDGLRALGWDTRRLDTHVSRAVQPTARQQLSVLRADAVVFTSGTQAESWVNIFGRTTPPVVVTIGPQTTEKTVHAGLKVTATATDHSLPGVVHALREVFGGSVASCGI